MPISFQVKPRHVGMFGAQGILRPLYQRQATQMALTEQQRQEQSRFEQMKALTEMRARLQQQLQKPLQEAQIGAAGARQEFSEFQLEQAQTEEELFRQYGTAGTPEEQRAILNQILVRKGVLREEQQKERIWYNPKTGQFERTTAAGVDYGPAALWKTGAEAGQQPLNIPMTGKDFAFEEDQARQLVGALGGEKLRPDVLKKLDIKQAGTVDNYINKFMGGEWNQNQMGEFAKILAYMTDPANEKAIRGDKQIQTIWSALRRLQRAYDPVWRDMVLRPQGAVTDTTQDTGFRTFQEEAGGGVLAPADAMTGQQPQLSPEEIQMMRALEAHQRALPPPTPFQTEEIPQVRKPLIGTEFPFSPMLPSSARRVY